MKAEHIGRQILLTSAYLIQGKTAIIMDAFDEVICIWTGKKEKFWRIQDIETGAIFVLKPHEQFKLLGQTII